MDKVVKITAEIMKNYRVRNKKKGFIWKVKDISEKIGISPICLSNYERGDRKIQLDLWFRWCDALGVSHRSVIEKINKELEKENAKNEVK